MTAHSTGGNSVAPGHRPAARIGTTRPKSLAIWVGMLAIVALEVAVTYSRPAMPTLVAALLVLAATQAFVGLMYFMHLRRERPVLGWTLVGALGFVLLLMNQLWPDALRLFGLRTHN